MFSLLGFKAKAAAFGAAALTILAFVVRLKFVTMQRDEATKVAETLKHRNKVIVDQRKIKREEEKQLLGELSKIKEEIEKPDEEFEGLENFNEPNDF